MLLLSCQTFDLISIIVKCKILLFCVLYSDPVYGSMWALGVVVLQLVYMQPLPAARARVSPAATQLLKTET